MRQGDPLSSTLFNVYINDFPSFINDRKVVDINTTSISTNCLLFADDIVLIGNSEADLQALIDIAYMWSKSWDITFNPNKCNVIHHRIKSTPVSKYVFSMGKHNPIKIVDSCKYLGIIIDAHVNFKSCINTLAQSGTRDLEY